MWDNRTCYQVAVWWPTEGYGGLRTFDTIHEAEGCAEQLKRDGYSHVHIRRVTTEVLLQWEKPRATKKK